MKKVNISILTSPCNLDCTPLILGDLEKNDVKKSEEAKSSSSSEAIAFYCMI